MNRQILILIVSIITNVSLYSQQGDFIIGIHRDPSILDVSENEALVRINRVKNCHFNLMSGVNGNHFNSYEDNLRRLELLSIVGIKTLIMDECYKDDNDVNCAKFKSYSSSQCKNSMINNYTGLNSELKEYLWGYYLGDEPGLNDSNTRQWVSLFNNNDNNHPTYYNLYPYYFLYHVEPPVPITKEVYEGYLDYYLTDCDDAEKPDAFSFDHYPFRIGKFLPSYFYNLQVISNKADNRPFYAIPILQKDGDSFIDIENKHIRFMVFCPMTYGASGVIYYFYRNTLDLDDAKYDYVKKVNLFLKDIIKPVIINSKRIGTYHQADTYHNEGDYWQFKLSELLKSSPHIPYAGNDNILIGLFKHSDGNHYAIVVNKSLNSIYNTTIELAGNHSGNVYISPDLEEYNTSLNPNYTLAQNIQYHKDPNTTTFTIPELEGGGCLVFKASYDNIFDECKMSDLSVKTDGGNWLINHSTTPNKYHTGWNWSSGNDAYGYADAHPVPADYDGDGITDLSVKTDSGNWLINLSSSPNQFNSGWNWSSGDSAYGLIDAHPVPADYDGDGKADLSIKTDGGNWMINYSSGVDSINSGWNWSSGNDAYGGSWAHPVPADYDGDGKADLSVKTDYGAWLINYSSSPDSINSGWNWSSGDGAYGLANAHPVPADYDGDGKADLSIWTEAGNWLINYSLSEDSINSGWNWSSGNGAYGDSDDIPIPADYDGDGMADLSIKTKEGNWLINFSSSPNKFNSGWNWSSGNDAYGGSDSHPVPAVYHKLTCSFKMAEQSIKKLNDSSVERLKFSLYPNPCSQKVNLKLQSEINESIHISIYSVDGKQEKLFRNISAKKIIPLNIGKLDSGLYFICIYWNNTVSYEKLIIQ